MILYHFMCIATFACTIYISNLIYMWRGRRCSKSNIISVYIRMYMEWLGVLHCKINEGCRFNTSLIWWVMHRLFAHVNHIPQPLTSNLCKIWISMINLSLALRYTYTYILKPFWQPKVYNKSMVNGNVEYLLSYVCPTAFEMTVTRIDDCGYTYIYPYLSMSMFVVCMDLAVWCGVV